MIFGKNTIMPGNAGVQPVRNPAVPVIGTSELLGKGGPVREKVILRGTTAGKTMRVVGRGNEEEK